MHQLFRLYAKWARIKLCLKCGHDIEDHTYNWSGPWDWYQCHCGCKIGE